MAVSSASTDVLAPLLARAPRLARLLPRLPRARFVEQSLRDLTMLASSFVRYRPVAHTYARADVGPSALGETLVLLANEEIASGTRLLTFARPAGFVFSAGQFLTFRLPLPGGEIRRSYSLCSAPHEDTLRVAVKRVEGGAGSAYLHGLAVSSRVAFRGPSGTFVYTPRDEAHRLLLIAGGSGITPILSIVKTALAASPSAVLTLFYAARTPREMAHCAELRALAAAQPRLSVRFFFDETGADETWDENDTLGRIGALDLAQSEGTDATTEVYLCGPEPMMDSVGGALEALSFPSEIVFRERFFTPRAAPLPARKERVSLKLLDYGLDLPVDPRRTLLESTLEAGLAVPYSCTMGGCGECKAHLGRGQVSMAEPNCLSRDEREDGCILPCISYPLTDVELGYPASPSAPSPSQPTLRNLSRREESSR